MSNQPTEHRRLAAIMFTDMVGYSALSQRNEALALELLEEHRQLLRAVFPKHQGHEIKSTGDGFLVEFASALAAVQCAVEIQKMMRDRNVSRSAERRVLIRIGIHLGDVVRRENDVFGDGVNIAARIEPLAEPGGICVSRAVYEQIENKVEHALVQLSRPALKNIQATVEVYRLLLDEVRTTRPVANQSLRRLVIVIAVVALIILAIPVFFTFQRHPASEQQAKSSSQTNTPAGASATVQGQPPVKTEIRILHSFGPTNVEGVNTWGPVTRASDGFLYGCTFNLGPGGGGSLYRVGTNGSDYAVIHSFVPATDGSDPVGGVIEARDGFLYGTTFKGGLNGAGSIFRVAKNGDEFRVLHHFAATNDCRNPLAELLEAKDGLLYGTARSGGGYGLGGVFRIAKDGTGYSILTGFNKGQSDDPRQPSGGLVQLPDRYFYGTTRLGGLKNNGTIFRLDAAGNVTVLKSLGLAGGGIMQPEGSLLWASDGLLYGTCSLGGTAGYGAAFRLSPDGSGFLILRQFGMTVGEAREPRAALIEARDGSLLGTSRVGGASDLGTIFKIGKDGRGYQTLHSFNGSYTDGALPRSPLTAGGAGVFFSSTMTGGSRNYGVVYQFQITEIR